MISEEMNKLIALLDEKSIASVSRIEAVTGKKPGLARYIEQFVYPSVNRRITKQITMINYAFMKYEKDVHGERNID